MARELHEVMLETMHGLCTWHLLKNGTKSLPYLPWGVSHILIAFTQCMYNIVDKEQFKASWSKLLLDNNVEDN